MSSTIVERVSALDTTFPPHAHRSGGAYSTSLSIVVGTGRDAGA